MLGSDEIWSPDENLKTDVSTTPSLLPQNCALCRNRRMEERGRGRYVHICFQNRGSSGIVDESKSQAFADWKEVRFRLLLLARWQQVPSTGCVARTSSVVVDEGCGRTMGIDCTYCHLDWMIEVHRWPLWVFFLPGSHAPGEESPLEGCSSIQRNWMKT